MRNVELEFEVGLQTLLSVSAFFKTTSWKKEVKWKESEEVTNEPVI